MYQSHAFGNRVLSSHATVENDNGEVTHVIFKITGRMKNAGLLVCKRAYNEDMSETFTLESMQFYDKGEFISTRRFIDNLEY